MKIEENERILFQGDSVTDVGRDREDGNSLGTGYPIKIRCSGYGRCKIRY